MFFLLKLLTGTTRVLTLVNSSELHIYAFSNNPLIIVISVIIFHLVNKAASYRIITRKKTTKESRNCFAARTRTGD